MHFSLYSLAASTEKASILKKIQRRLSNIGCCGSNSVAAASNFAVAPFTTFANPLDMAEITNTDVEPEITKIDDGLGADYYVANILAHSDCASLHVPEKRKISQKEPVLIVEDNDLSYRILERYCEKIGFEKVIRAENGKKAVEIFQNFKPPLIFMDRNMPVIDGIEATQKIRAAQGKMETTPLIICCSNDSTEEAQKLYEECGMDGYFYKPFKGGVRKLKEALEDHVIFEKEISKL